MRQAKLFLGTKKICVQVLIQKVVLVTAEAVNSQTCAIKST